MAGQGIQELVEAMRGHAIPWVAAGGEALAGYFSEGDVEAATQRILPFGSAEDVRRETRRLFELGAQGGYIFAPAHDVEGDVPLENMLAAIDTVQAQPGD